MECQDCGGTAFDEAHGEQTCASCGLVQAWARAEAATLPPQASVRRQEEAVGSPEVRRRAALGCAQIRDLCERVALHAGIQDAACDVLTRACERPEWKQRKHANHAGVIAACVFHACNIVRGPRTPLELCRLLRVEVRNMRRMVKTLQLAADDVAAKYIGAPPVLDVDRDLVPRYLELLGISGPKRSELRRFCASTYRSLRKALENHRPETIAGCLILLALRKRGGAPGVTDQSVANVCFVTPNTIVHLVGELEGRVK